MIGQEEPPSPIPAYALTGGRMRSRHGIEVHTLLLAVTEAAELPPTASRQQRGLLRLCQGGLLSVAEAAAYLEQPVSVITVLADALVGSGHLRAQTHTAPHDLALLEEVLDGLRNL